ncbi:extracellular solute-binding protein [Chloroflexi bacterium TSY]|nr:extracellular solute-binding protein [Chloroflexi bacterium TSY]
MKLQQHFHSDDRACPHYLTLIIMFALLIGTIAGCAAPASPGGSQAESADSAEPIKIRFWHNAGGRQELYEGQAAAFEELHPGIDIEVVFQGGGREVMQKAQASLAAGDPPEVTFVSPDAAAPLITDGVLVDLTSDIEADADFNADDISQVLWDAATWDGKVTMGPKDFQAWVLYYNTDLFEEAGLEPPTNWQELEETAAALTQDTDGDGKTDIFGIDIWSGGVNTFLSFLYNAGGAFLDDSQTEAVFNQEPGPGGIGAL